ncbi:uncharacterized protein LOC112269869 [Brachypodium distachyon]|uniref:Uncharacterized protein n=1 Tax=Brachypodium distachyon TaxID=15368 RepID=A0A0Q3GMH7_BRADI|nr:uncharacterized protein LOC112269869 [Brachypodium distachyon]KQK12279.1 hypothetical protein BRADI_1g02635v3 [Brachypodium distachyon]|eukprot:XP_024313054.1 uncharacterized protein LOC112269869 [Brachypodium distachyon]
MKPPHFTGEAAAGASWAHEVKQALRDKLRWTVAAARPTSAVAVAGAGAGAGAAAEDPIRRVMFLAPWGHT